MNARGLALVITAAMVAAWALSAMPPVQITVNSPGPAPVEARTAPGVPVAAQEAAEPPTEAASPPAIADAEPYAPSAVLAAPEEAAPFSRPGPAAIAVPGSRAIDMPILIYHTIRPGPPPASQMARWLTVTPEAFEQQLKFLKDNGYHSISFSQLADFLEKGIALPDRPAIISFDDGWDNQFVYGYPLLLKYGFGATFFVVTNYLDRPNFMTIEQLKTMIANGMAIGAHTRSHPALAGIGNPHKQWDEIAGSKSFLEERLGVAIDTFAYPYGSYNAAVEAMVKAAGFRTARTVNFGTHYTADDLATLAGLTFPIYVNHYRGKVELTAHEMAR